VFGRLAGYEDMNDAERLCQDPAMRWVVGDRAIAGFAASASQMGRFETQWLCRPENLAALADLSGQWIDRVHQRRSPRMIVLDMDSSESPTYGEQEGSAYNGHFGCTCYHPLFVFNQFGDVERSALRPGNVHSADGWRAVLEPVIARYRGSVKVAAAIETVVTGFGALRGVDCSRASLTLATTMMIFAAGQILIPAAWQPRPPDNSSNKPSTLPSPGG
jgi:hypothetical protein